MAGTGAFRPSRLSASRAMGRLRSAAHRGQAQRERRVAAGVRPVGQHHFVVGHPDVRVAGDGGHGTVRAGLRFPPAPGSEETSGGALLAGPRPPAAPGVVAFPGHGTPGGGHGQHQRVRIGRTEGAGHLVLFLEEQLVLLPTGPAVQLDPDRRQRRPGIVDGDGVHVVGQNRNGLHQRSQGGDIPQAAVGLLEIGLQQEPDIPVRTVPLGDQVGEHPEPRWLLLRPPVAGTLEHRLGHLGIAADDPPVKQAQRHPQVYAGQVEGLGRPPDAVVE